MNVLSLSCDNLFMFKDFSVDFTYKRKRGPKEYEVSKQDALFPGSKIYVRKRLIILGGNASGKTTFGRLLCAINNFIVGREVKPSAVNLYQALCDKEKDGSFSVEFVISIPNVETKEIEYWAYRMGCIFDIKGKQKEFLKRVRVYKSYDIGKLREYLDRAPMISSEPGNEPADHLIDEALRRKDKAPFNSMLLREPGNKKYLNELNFSIGFYYLFSSFADTSRDISNIVPIELFNQVLPKIDNSISSVELLATEETNVKTNSYWIRFKHGAPLTVPDNDLMRADRDRLSHGTYEVISFLEILAELNRRKDNIFYIDEQLPHLHPELEAYLLMKFFYSDASSQLFFTSHDNDLLKLNVPPRTFLLFKRNEDQSNTALFMDEVLPGNVRDIRYYYDNDYFGIMPDYSALDDFFAAEEDHHEEK